MSSTLFSASKIKLVRAEQFIGELNAVVKAYKLSSPFSGFFFGEHNENVRVNMASFGLLPGAIIGDIVHNLRASLDLMASELARMNEKSDKNVYFPFSDTKDNFEAAIKARNFHKAGADAVVLLRTFEPYKGGNEALRAIHDLDVSDKHTALIPTNRTVEGMKLTYDIKDASTLSFDHKDVFFSFPDGTALAGMEIVETLEHLMGMVDGIIEAFAELVIGREATTDDGAAVRRQNIWH